MSCQLYNPDTNTLRFPTPKELEARDRYQRAVARNAQDGQLARSKYGRINIHIISGLLCILYSKPNDRPEVWYFFDKQLRVRIGKQWLEAKPYQRKIYIDFLWRDQEQSREYTINSAGTKATISRGDDRLLYIKKEGSKTHLLIMAFQ